MINGLLSKSLFASIIFFILLLSPLLSSTTADYDPSNSISPRPGPVLNGTIVGSAIFETTPLSGYFIKLKQGSTVIEETTTNDSGGFDFGSHEAGTYSIMVDGGYKFQDEENSSIVVLFDAETHVDFNLIEKQKCLVEVTVSFSNSYPDGGGAFQDIIIEPYQWRDGEYVGLTSANPDSQGNCLLWIYEDNIYEDQIETIMATLDHYETAYLDVTLVPNGTSRDNHICLTPDWALTTSPSFMAYDIDPPEAITISCNYQLNLSSFNPSTINLTGGSSQDNLLDENSFYLDKSGKKEKLVITPISPLIGNTTYTLTISKEIKASNRPSSFNILWTDYITWFITRVTDGTIMGFVFSCDIEESELAPLENVTINCGPYQTTTDIDGSYNIKALEGTYKISAKKVGYTVVETPEEVLVLSDMVSDNINFTIRKTRLSDICDYPQLPQNGVPIQDFSFILSFNIPINQTVFSTNTIILKPKTRAIVNGTVTFDGSNLTYLAAGDLEYNTTYTLIVKSDHILDPFGETILLSDWVIDFTTETTCSVCTDLQITILDEDTDLPIQYANVTYGSFMNRADINGIVIFSDLFIGENHTIIISAPGYQTKYLDFKIKPGKNLLEVFLGYDPSYYEYDIVSDYFLNVGPILDDEGNPLGGAKITIIICGDEYSATTDSSGMATFFLGDLSIIDCEDDIKVIFQHEDYNSKEWIISFEDLIHLLENDNDLNFTEDPPVPYDKPSSDPPKTSLSVILGILFVILLVIVIILFSIFKTKMQSEERIETDDDERFRRI